VFDSEIGEGRGVEKGVGEVFHQSILLPKNRTEELGGKMAC